MRSGRKSEKYHGGASAFPSGGNHPGEKVLAHQTVREVFKTLLWNLKGKKKKSREEAKRRMARSQYDTLGKHSPLGTGLSFLC